MNRDDKFCVGIPTYNEAGTIEKLVYNLKELGAHVVVMDDSSPDNTAKFAELAGAEVISRPPKSGLASAYLDLLKSSPCRYMVTFDAGGTHRPIDALTLYRLRKSADIVIAQRRFTGVSYRRWLSFAATLGFIRYGITDVTCGLRCYDTDIEIPTLEAKGHIFQAELLKKLLNKGYTTRQYEIPYILDTNSHVRLWEIVEAVKISAKIARSV